MKGLYKKANFEETWGRVEGLLEGLNLVYESFEKTKKPNLAYPIIDLAFHTMEKIALAVLFKKKGKYLGSHSQISRDFEEEFKDHSAFKEMIMIYREIMEQKDSLLYHFDKTISEEKLSKYISYIIKFKGRAENYINS